MQIVSLGLCHIGTNRSVLWPSKYAKIRFRPRLCPEPLWGAHDAPQTPQLARDGTSLPIPHFTLHRPTFGACHASPQNSSQIYAYKHITESELHGWNNRFLFLQTSVGEKCTHSAANLFQDVMTELLNSFPQFFNGVTTQRMRRSSEAIGMHNDVLISALTEETAMVLSLMSVKTAAGASARRGGVQGGPGVRTPPATAKTTREICVIPVS